MNDDKYYKQLLDSLQSLYEQGYLGVPPDIETEEEFVARMREEDNQMKEFDNIVYGKKGLE